MAGERENEKSRLTFESTVHACLELKIAVHEARETREFSASLRARCGRDDGGDPGRKVRSRGVGLAPTRGGQKLGWKRRGKRAQTRIERVDGNVARRRIPREMIKIPSPSSPDQIKIERIEEKSKKRKKKSD